jgi:hypothetical protein
LLEILNTPLPLFKVPFVPTFILADPAFPYTSSVAPGDGVPIPTLPLLLTTIGVLGLPIVEVPVKTGTVPEVPLPVTVCAAAPADANAKQRPSHMHTDLLIIVNPFVSIGCSFCSRPA